MWSGNEQEIQENMQKQQLPFQTRQSQAQEQASREWGEDSPAGLGGNMGSCTEHVSFPECTSHGPKTGGPSERCAHRSRSWEQPESREAGLASVLSNLALEGAETRLGSVAPVPTTVLWWQKGWGHSDAEDPSSTPTLLLAWESDDIYS